MPRPAMPYEAYLAFIRATAPPVTLNPLPTDDLAEGEIGLLAGGA